LINAGVFLKTDRKIYSTILIDGKSATENGSLGRRFKLLIYQNLSYPTSRANDFLLITEHCFGAQ
jgi:hypothetical protein